MDEDFPIESIAKMDLRDQPQAGSEALSVSKSEPIGTPLKKFKKSDDEQVVIPEIVESNKKFVKKLGFESDDSLETVLSSRNVSQYFFRILKN